MAKVVILLADGFEEIEALSVIDILRRAGIDAVTAGLHDKPVESSHGVKIITDDTIDNIHTNDFDMIFLPGGQPGSDTLNADKRVIDLIQSFYRADKWVGAICAAPYVLGTAGILADKKATSYPGFDSKMPGAIYSTESVVIDGKIITGRGPGTAALLAFTIVEQLAGAKTAAKLKSGMLFQ